MLPAGAFLTIRDGKIANYQAVVPSTWNAGPRDAKSQVGPYEASLIGNPVADAEPGDALAEGDDLATQLDPRGER